MTYVVLARKWRPQTFSELVGQEPVVQTLQNAIELGRVSHAVLLTGPRGIGKTTTARILAKALNCEKGPTISPCGKCSNCKEIALGNSVDVLEVDGASNTKVDEIRDLLDNVQYRPQKSRYKIYIIDEVHMLSTHSFNALLKTLEEPPQGVMFIFATTEPQKIPETILSRCQRFDLRQISDDQIARQLRKIVDVEKITITDGSLRLISRAASGGMRDALSLLDQVVAYSGEKIKEEEVASVLGLTDRTLLNETIRAFVGHQTEPALQCLSQVFAKGFDPKTYVLDLISVVRDLLMLKIGASTSLLQGTPDEVAKLKEWATQLEPPELERWFDLLKGLSIEIGRSEFPKAVAEVAFIRVTRQETRLSLPDLLSRLENLESKLGRPGTTTGIPKPLVPKKTEVSSLGTEKNWEEFVTQVKRRKPAWAAILLQSSKASAEGSVITLTFDEGSFYESRARDADFQNFLIELAKEILGGDFTVQIDRQLKKKETSSPAAEGRAREKEALENPLVQKAVSLFDARVEEVKSIK